MYDSYICLIKIDGNIPKVLLNYHFRKVLTIIGFAILDGAKHCIKEAKSRTFTLLRSVQDAKKPNYRLFKKRKGLRQGGKEGLKTSARNPLFSNTPNSDKSSFRLTPEKLFG